MPTYEYECSSCKHRFEKFQSIRDSALRKCPACGRLKLRRLVSGGGGFIFKGSGFYQTDYRSESYRKSAEKEKKAEKGKDAGGEDAKSTGTGSKKAEQKSDGGKQSTGGGGEE